MESIHLKGIEKAAIVVSALGGDFAGEILKKLKDDEVTKIILTMKQIGSASQPTIDSVLQEFYQQIIELNALLFGIDETNRDALIKVLGEERASRIVKLLEDSTVQHKLGALELVDTKSLANYLMNEHPQTIALIMSYLDNDKRCEVLTRLPETLQSDVVYRMANIDFISPEVIAHLDEILSEELANMKTAGAKKLGGIQPIADMLNAMDKATETLILSKIEERDPALAQEIRKIMFVFEDLAKIDDRGIQLLLKEVENEKLIIALKTAPETIKSKIFNNMSKRAVTMLLEDLEVLGPVKLSDVEAAQQVIVNVARRLEEEGKIVIVRGGEGEMLV